MDTSSQSFVDQHLELVIETWTHFDGRSEQLWSLWRGEERLRIAGPFKSVQAARDSATKFIEEHLGEVQVRIKEL